jgi:hypothetical protein
MKNKKVQRHQTQQGSMREYSHHCRQGSLHITGEDPRTANKDPCKTRNAPCEDPRKDPHFFIKTCLVANFLEVEIATLARKVMMTGMKLQAAFWYNQLQTLAEDYEEMTNGNLPSRLVDYDGLCMLETLRGVSSFLGQVIHLSKQAHKANWFTKLEQKYHRLCMLRSQLSQVSFGNFNSTNGQICTNTILANKLSLMQINDVVTSIS